METRIGDYDLDDLELLRWPYLGIMAIGTKRGDILLQKEALSISSSCLPFIDKSQTNRLLPITGR